jgi:hypothetical protein
MREGTRGLVEQMEQLVGPTEGLAAAREVKAAEADAALAELKRRMGN